MTFIDISPVVDAAIAVWPGDTPYSHTRDSFHTTVHVGAHADAPSHYISYGEDIATRSLHYYLGSCVVLHIEGVRGRRITPDDLRGKRVLAPRVLLRTETFPDPRQWNDDFASLSPELVEDLHRMGVITIGIDTPSVDPMESKALEAHHALARHNMANLEGLVLGGVAEGRYELIALPLRLAGADGSPLRAVLRTLV